jgi:hypothetical protein
MNLFKLTFISLVLTIAAILSFTGPPAGATEVANKGQLLAAFTFNIVKFAKWSQNNSLKAANSKIRIGVYRNVGLRISLESLTKGKISDSHELSAFDLNADSLNATSAPEVVILIPEAGELSSATLKSLRNCNCLTITYGQSDDRNGSIVNFYTDDDHLRFAIDLDKSKAEGIELSSQLLKLGKLL